MHGNDDEDKRHRQQQGQGGECDYSTPLVGAVVKVQWRGGPSDGGAQFGKIVTS
jgi:hypothetical protein